MEKIRAKKWCGLYIYSLLFPFLYRLSLKIDTKSCFWFARLFSRETEIDTAVQKSCALVRIRAIRAEKHQTFDCKTIKRNSARMHECTNIFQILWAVLVKYFIGIRLLSFSCAICWSRFDSMVKLILLIVCLCSESFAQQVSSQPPRGQGSFTPSTLLSHVGVDRRTLVFFADELTTTNDEYVNMISLKIYFE